MHSRISEAQLSRADVVIRPKVGRIGPADFDRRHDAVMEGEKAAIDALPAIQNILAKLKQSGRLE
jgi:NTE family protein